MRCAMMIFVLPGMAVFSARRMCSSVAMSTALVESSRIRIFGCFTMARAMRRRCFCPPERFAAFCSRTVS